MTKTLGNRIRETRTTQGTSLRALARALEITPSYLSDIENGRRMPSEGILHGLARALGISVEALACRVTIAIEVLEGMIGGATEHHYSVGPGPDPDARVIGVRFDGRALILEYDKPVAQPLLRMLAAADQSAEAGGEEKC